MVSAFRDFALNGEVRERVFAIGYIGCTCEDFKRTQRLRLHGGNFIQGLISYLFNIVGE